jgi:xanthine dehydrogenase iron-sulfur cluster and FAD-binding subunit A
MANGVRLERLVLALNGQRYEVASDDLDPSTTVLEFTRTRTPLRGPKLGCGEGAYIYIYALTSIYSPVRDDKATLQCLYYGITCIYIYAAPL